MADTTFTLAYTTGATLYTQIASPTGTLWNGSAYATYALASYTSFATATTETPALSGLYVCQFPTSSAAGNYKARTYLQTGVTPTQKGVVSLTLSAGGTGFTNGTGYAIAFSGGSPAVNATGLFDVSGGAVTNLRVTNCGVGFSSAPTLSFAAAGAGTGASATATLGSDPCVGTITAFWDGTTFGGASSVPGSVGSVTSGVVANVIHSGTARGGSANTITLDTGASSVDNTYQQNQITLTGGTGAGQTGVVLYGGYVGLNRVATMSTNWATAPDSTTTFQIIPMGGVVLGAIGGTARTVTQDYLGTDSLTVVSQATGLPISGATVTAYLASQFSSQGTNAPVVTSTTTNSLGHWSLSLNPSAYVVVFAFASESSQATFTVT